MSRKTHNCADYLYDRRGSVNDTIICFCGQHFTLRRRTRALTLAWWRGISSVVGDDVLWVRNRAAERAARRRERILREREWRRP